MRVIIAFVLATAGLGAGGAASLPGQLDPAAFWRLSTELSEPVGAFPSDNLVSNEVWFPTILDELIARVPQRGVYVGVGPEQNFTYIAATHPGLAMIIDVRRGNLQLHLLYKAIFELSDSRAAFISRLFGRNVPSHVRNTAPAAQLFGSIEELEPNRSLEDDYAAIERQLVKNDHLPLSANDLSAIQMLFEEFRNRGPAISYGDFGMPTYALLMQRTDGQQERSFLSSEAAFHVVRDLERRHLVIPIVGNLAGPTALRAIGDYARAHQATIDVMYLSNVEQYLRRDASWRAFCLNVRTLPLTDASTFVRSAALYNTGRGGGQLMSSLGRMLEQTASCATGGSQFRRRPADWR